MKKMKYKEITLSFLILLFIASNTLKAQTTGKFTDSRDGNTYKTVKIGNQTWMAENLNYNAGSGSWCYDDKSSNCDKYGRLYNWPAAMDGSSSSSSNPSGVQGICPDGWHLPSDDEWKELEMELGMSQADADDTNWRGTNKGSKLAGNAGLWPDGDLDQNPEFGSSGFSALPGGYRSYGGGFGYMGGYAYFWSSTEGGSSFAWGRKLGYGSTGVYRNGGGKDSGFSVRCVRD